LSEVSGSDLGVGVLATVDVKTLTDILRTQSESLPDELDGQCAGAQSPSGSVV